MTCTHCTGKRPCRICVKQGWCANCGRSLPPTRRRRVKAKPDNNRKDIMSKFIIIALVLLSLLAVAAPALAAASWS